METKDKNLVREVVSAELAQVFTDNAERETIIDSVIDDVVVDIDENANDDWNFSDISIALQRVLYNKIAA